MATGRELLCLTDCGLYCPAGGFYIDPWKAVDRAVITHAHSDHARYGMNQYLCAERGEEILRLRVGENASITTMGYGETLHLGQVSLSLHPAGHILGSSQVRIELGGQVAVVSGDYKTQPDSTCDPFEPLRCHTFVTESTFGLPIYRWPQQAEVTRQIHTWWRGNQAMGKCSILLGYALGKCQRALALLDPETGPIFLHGAVQNMTDAYRRQGVHFPPTAQVGEATKGFDWSKALILAPPSANGTPWLRRFGDHSTAFMSGWMAIRGARRRRALDRGFVISDHVDWPSLIDTIRQTEAEAVWVTHGYSNVVVRYLQEMGIASQVLATRWEGEQDQGSAEEDANALSESESKSAAGGYLE